MSAFALGHLVPREEVNFDQDDLREEQADVYEPRRLEDALHMNEELRVEDREGDEHRAPCEGSDRACETGVRIEEKPLHSQLLDPPPLATLSPILF